MKYMLLFCERILSNNFKYVAQLYFKLYHLEQDYSNNVNVIQGIIKMTKNNI